MDKKIGKQIYLNLLQKTPNPKSELYFTNELECLIAVMLSAQCTDKRVSNATVKLFKDFHCAQDYANCKDEDLNPYLKSINFYPTKTKNIIAMCRQLVAKFNGQVPSTLEELLTLPGVGRKTAQVVLVEAFLKPAVPVDTHIFRVCNRLGICCAKTVLETEEAFRKVFDEKDFITLHKLLVLHGRYVCKAKNPDCENCVLNNLCEKRK